MELHKITVNLVPKADLALQAAAEREGLNRTDTLNRALQFYDFFSEEAARDTKIMLVRKDGETLLLPWVLS